jgi:hypothetical protein
MNTVGLHLELRDGADGYRHYLGARGVHCGDSLDLLLGNNEWLRGRYEIKYTTVGKVPKFHFYVAHGDVCREVSIELLPESLLRWPTVLLAHEQHDQHVVGTEVR